MALTMKEVRQAGCAHADHKPGESCEELVLHQRCHYKKGLTVAVNKTTGELVVVCFVCQKEVARFKVAE